MLTRSRALRPLRSAPSWRGPRALLSGLVLVLVLVMGAAQAQERAAPSRIAYVDMKRLIDESPQVRGARARLQREFDAAIALLRGDEARLDELERRLADASSSGDADAAARLRTQLDPLKRSVERTRERLRSDLDSRSEQEVERAWPLINEAIADYARSNNLDLVLSSGALYVSGRVDITDRVLELLERESAEEAQP
jgi:outer membrane protein